MKHRADAEILFGSVSRGDGDSLSDRDILIVDKDPSFLRSRRLALEEEGWSVAAYTWARLEALSMRGSLFIQHLKTESTIISDEGGRFKRVVSNFLPKKSYRTEILANRELANLVSNYPATSKGVLWATDVLYVCLRNFGVLSLAESGVFKFSFNQIIDEFVSCGSLSRKQSLPLRQLRLMKSLYRGGADFSFERSHAILREVVWALPVQVLGCNPTPREPLSLILNAKILPSSASPYARLRNLEKLFVAISVISPAVCNSGRFLELKKWIENPRLYTALGSLNEAAFVSEITNDLFAIPGLQKRNVS